MLPLLEPAFAFSRTLPVDLLQTLFALLDPWGVADKYRGFAGLRQDSERARLFVALEDWLNDGVPLAAEVARSCLGEWYGENAPARGDWRIAGLPVRPGAIRTPAFVAVPGRDRIVPPESRDPLGPRDPGRGAAPAGGRACRHGRRRAGGDGAVAAVAGLAARAGLALIPVAFEGDVAAQPSWPGLVRATYGRTCRDRWPGQAGP